MGKKLAAEKKAAARGGGGFESYYGGVFGGRWPRLKVALSAGPMHARWDSGGSAPYFLDPASVFAALQLPVDGARRILDMCAAPGGKTLVLASRMPEDAALDANERSAVRRQRLFRVCDECLPEAVRSRVRILGLDGARMCRTGVQYDRILLDAPCSSERHVLESPKHLAEWSPSRVKSLAVEQWALLSSAYRMLSPGGFLLYSTCALCPEENDGVAARLLKKFPDAADVFDGGGTAPGVHEDVSPFCAQEFSFSPERTAHGWHILPDSCGGCGPIWFSLLKKAEGAGSAQY
ncbi:MAG: RsmB/NOP family class I SAM-dependent RNA methyltransferase [Treponemataceae bacterium]|nr:RsmB/NOP family class I SAM-dependent RNA methyltransferase [Treponemataceae bacterium]